MMKNTIILLAFAFCLVAKAQVIKIDSGLVVCYPFSGNANDMSGNGHNATVVGATLTTDRFGSANSAYKFYNDTSSYITLPNFGNVITTNNIAISFWSMANSNTSDEPFLVVPDIDTNRLGIAVNYTSVGLIWDYGSIYSSGGRMVYGAPYSNLWQHFVFQVSQSKNIKEIYMNGVMVDSSTTYGMGYTSGNRSLHIGGGMGWSGSWLGFPGVIDDIRIYDRALTKKEVDSLYNAPSTGISCQASTGIKTFNAQNATFSIYPNPTTNSLQVSISSEQMIPGNCVLITVTDVLGNTVIKNSDITTQNYQIDVSALNSGVYFVRIGNSTQKFVKE